MAAPERPRLGLVGLGNMGRPIAARLAAAGFPLTIHDTRMDAVRDVVARTRAAAAPSLAALGAASNVVVTLLPDGAAVRRVALGPGDALADGMAAGSVLVDMGSSAPVGTRALGAALAERGIALLDAPVSGGVRRAEAGTLSIMVGGDPAIADRCAPLFGAIGAQVFRTGALGSGHAMKALNNLVSAAGLVAAVEALCIGRRFGLDPAVMIEVLNASTGRNNATENKLTQFVLSRRFDSGFSLALMLKDVETALELARDTSTDAPAAAACAALWARAAATLEPDADHTSVARFLERLAGTTLGGPAA